VVRIARLRLFIVPVVASATLALGAGCGNDGGSSQPPGPTATTAQGPTTAASGPITAACPLVDVATVASTFKVQSPQAKENEPVKTGPATAYSCDFADGGETFVTVGVVVGPASGTVEANVRAALSNAVGEPVSGIGDGGAYAETGGVGTAAGVKKVGSEYRLVFAHGAAGNKEQIVAMAREVATKV